MPLRSELQASAIPSEHLATIRQRIEQIEGLIETNTSAAQDAIRDFNAATNRSFTLAHFQHYWRAESLDDFARRAARPQPKPPGNVTREELIEVVRRAMPTSGDPDYEYYAEIFDANVVMPLASNLIYYPPEGMSVDVNMYDPSAEEIVDYALAYKPILL